MAEMPTVQLVARMRWWVKPYIYTLAWFCNTFDMEPNWDRVEARLARAFKVKPKQ